VENTQTEGLSPSDNTLRRHRPSTSSLSPLPQRQPPKQSQRRPLSSPSTLTPEITRLIYSPRPPSPRPRPTSMSSSPHTRPASTSSTYTHTRPVSTSSSLTPQTRPSSSSSSYSIGPLYPLPPKQHANVTDSQGRTSASGNIATSTNSSTTSVDFPYESIRKRKDSRTIKKLTLHKSFELQKLSGENNDTEIEAEGVTEGADAVNKMNSASSNHDGESDDDHNNTTIDANNTRKRRRSVPQRIMGWVKHVVRRSDKKH